eukprot:TRINITY_DN27629_c0_g1_i1.p1 TRINITY_DN27629_c0_g1~~TRINITY_DN27629_c0_g1_i1.p1  ORF type:complete len:114 (+),score=23.56 TRINITY_DN27629_c0_g1_i1:36-377(+)
MSFARSVVVFVCALLAVPALNYVWAHGIMSIYKTQRNLQDLIEKEGTVVFLQRCLVAALLIVAMWIGNRFQEEGLSAAASMGPVKSADVVEGPATAATCAETNAKSSADKKTD